MQRRQLFALPALLAAPAIAQERVVNIYSARHYDTDRELWEGFTRGSGVRIHVIEANVDQLLERLRAEGANSPADILVCESTYGNRHHVPVGETVEKLYAAVRQTVARGGKALIPAFSLGRTQLVVHYLQQGLRAGKVPTSWCFSI